MKQLLLKVWESRRHIWGAPRITKRLHEMGYPISQRFVWHLMKSLAIRSTIVKKANRLTTPVSMLQKPNLICHLADLSGVLTTDITYIQLINQRLVYLATLFDPETRAVVSYRVGDAITAEFAVSVLSDAKKYWYKLLIIHTDMGSQYTSKHFEAMLKKLRIKHSYSRIGRSGDNARIEALHSLLKRERVNHMTYQTIEEVRADMGWYMNFYRESQLLKLIA